MSENLKNAEMLLDPERSKEMQIAAEKVNRAIEIYQGNQDGTRDGISSMRKIEGEDGGEQDVQLTALMAGLLIENSSRRNEIAERIARSLKGKEKNLSALFEGIVNKIREDISHGDFWTAAVMRHAAKALEAVVAEWKSNVYGGDEDYESISSFYENIANKLHALDVEIADEVRILSKNIQGDQAPRIIDEAASRPGVFSEHSAYIWWLAPLEKKYS